MCLLAYKLQLLCAMIELITTVIIKKELITTVEIYTPEE